MAASSHRYTIRIRGCLGPTARSAFPTMAVELSGGETVLTGTLEDQAAVYGILAQLEALGLELIELRRTEKSPGSGEGTPPGSRRPFARRRTSTKERFADEQRAAEPAGCDPAPGPARHSSRCRLGTGGP